MDTPRTESRNQATMYLDEMATHQILTTMNTEDHHVAEAITPVLPMIGKLVDHIVQQLSHCGRLIYMGAGTSGRLGVLDAAECVPTFNISPNQIIGLIAGGPSAMTQAIEGAEDNINAAQQDLKDLALTEQDVVIGIAASGQTPYVIGGLQYAKDSGATTASIACNTNAKISALTEYPIEVDVGPEILTGSTRLKSGTAQKLILNMISTATMVKLGKVFGNLMIDVKPTNTKLQQRVYHILSDICKISLDTATTLYHEAHQDIKIAIVMHYCDINYNQAKQRLQQHNGVIKHAIK